MIFDHSNKMRLRRFFYFVIALPVLTIGFFSFLQPTLAADPIQLSVPLPGCSLSGKPPVCTVSGAAEYINIFYKYFLTIISGLAMFMILFAGLRWITAAGNSSAIGSAKQMITSALIGLILAYGSVLILRFINIDLVELKALDIPVITPASPTGLFADACPETFNTSGVECGGVFIDTRLLPSGSKTECTAWKDTCKNPTEFCLPVGGGGGTDWKCSTFNNYCEIETSKDNCEVADSIILNLYHQTNNACAKDEQHLGLSRKCIWDSILFCNNRSQFDVKDADPAIVPPPGAAVDNARASCVAGTDKSECNDDGQPEDCDITGVTMCTDKARAVKGADCVCCKLVDNIQCLPVCDGTQTVVSNERCIAKISTDCAARGETCCATLQRKLE